MTAPHTLTLYRVPTGFTYTPEGEGAKELLAMRWLNPVAGLTAWRAHILAVVAAGRPGDVLGMPVESVVVFERADLPAWLGPHIPDDRHGINLWQIAERLGDHKRFAHEQKRVEWTWTADDLTVEVVDALLRVSFRPTVSARMAGRTRKTVTVDGVEYAAEEVNWYDLCVNRTIYTAPLVYTVTMARDEIQIADWPT